MRTETVFIPYLGESTNSYINRGKPHWLYRSEKNKALKAAQAAGLHLLDPFLSPVVIAFQPNLGKKRRNYDVSNYSMSYKILEDVLRASELLKDDTPEYVRGIFQGCPVPAADGVEGILITITEVDGELPPEQIGLELVEQPAF